MSQRKGSLIVCLGLLAPARTPGQGHMAASGARPPEPETASGGVACPCGPGKMASRKRNVTEMLATQPTQAGILSSSPSRALTTSRQALHPLKMQGLALLFWEAAHETLRSKYADGSAGKICTALMRISSYAVDPSAHSPRPPATLLFSILASVASRDLPQLRPATGSLPWKAREVTPG